MMRMVSYFKFIDHTADIAVEVSGNTYEELFLAALNGWKNSVVELSRKKYVTHEREFNLKENSPEELLVSFLQEMNYLLESKKIFPFDIKNINIEKIDETFLLESTILFGNIAKEDIVKTEIKAVTFHQLDIKRVNGVYKTIIVFDI